MRHSKLFHPFLPAVFLASLLAGLPALASAQRAGAALVTQRRINEWAAALERARFAIVEDTRLRQPHETLDSYLKRIAQPLPGEPPAAYDRRITGYLDALSAAVDATEPARRMPALKDESLSNRQVWQRAVRDIGLLPKRVRLLRSAWQATWHLLSGRSVHSFGAELAQTLDLVLAAFASLRDARP
jgi:hypothetical protein